MPRVIHVRDYIATHFSVLRFAGVTAFLDNNFLHCPFPHFIV